MGIWFSDKRKIARKRIISDHLRYFYEIILKITVLTLILNVL